VGKKMYFNFPAKIAENLGSAAFEPLKRVKKGQ
jgi:hypothetical protein